MNYIIYKYEYYIVNSDIFKIYVLYKTSINYYIYITFYRNNTRGIP